MSINACGINRNTINTLCRKYMPMVLSATVSSFTTTQYESQVVNPIIIGTFSGGPITSVSIISGSLNGTSGTLMFSTVGTFSGNILFSGTTGTDLGNFSGVVRVQGPNGHIDITFGVTVFANVSAGGGGHPQHVHPDTTIPHNIFRRDQSEEEDIDLTTIEMPFIQVSIEFQGTRFEQTLERKSLDDVAVLSVSDLRTVEEISVNIFDVQMRPLP